MLSVGHACRRGYDCLRLSPQVPVYCMHTYTYIVICLVHVVYKYHATVNLISYTVLSSLYCATLHPYQIDIYNSHILIHIYIP